MTKQKVTQRISASKLNFHVSKRIYERRIQHETFMMDISISLSSFHRLSIFLFDLSFFPLLRDSQKFHNTQEGGDRLEGDNSTKDEGKKFNENTISVWDQSVLGISLEAYNPSDSSSTVSIWRTRSSLQQLETTLSVRSLTEWACRQSCKSNL